MNKKNIFVWSLYDFANSFVFITFLLYFSKWMVVNRGLSDWWYNATFILGSIGLVFLAPYFGSRADTHNNGRKYLIWSTLGCFVFYSLAIISAISGMSIFLSALAFGLGNFFYQLSFIFYNPLLNNISRPENQGRVSGIGFLANYLGQIGGILISLPFVSGKITIPGVDSLVAPLIPATIIFLVLAIPLLMRKEIFNLSTYKAVEKKLSQWRLLRSIIVLPGVLMFMIAFFLFSDAITTIINNASIFTSQVFSVTDSQISLLILFVIVFAGLGAYGWGLLSDKFGAKRILITNLMAWVVIIPFMSWVTTYSVFFVATAFAGLCIGGSFSISRKVLIELVPQANLNYAFGIYAISERAATIVGPLAWTMVLAAGGYRGAMFSMVIFQIVSIFLMLKISRKTQTA